MINVLSGEQLALEAMKRDLKRLSKIAEKAKAACDEYVDIGTEAIAIHQELAKLVQSNEHGQVVIDKLDALKVRREKVEKIRRKDFLALCNKQGIAEISRDNLIAEIGRLSFRIELRSGKNRN
jgi:hypothetical protein